MNDKERGILLREARKKKGLSQEELGILLNYSNNTIYNWEKGLSQPSTYNTLIKLGRILDLSPIDILYGQKNANEQTIALGYLRLKQKHFLLFINLIISLLMVFVLIILITYETMIKGSISTYQLRSIKYGVNGYLFISNDINILNMNKIDKDNIEEIVLYYKINDKKYIIFEGINDNYYIENRNNINEYNINNIEKQKVFLEIIYSNKTMEEIPIYFKKRYINNKINKKISSNNKNKDNNKYKVLLENGFYKKDNKYIKEIDNITINYMIDSKTFIVYINNDEYLEQIYKRNKTIIYEKIGLYGEYKKEELKITFKDKCYNYSSIENIIYCLNYLENEI